MSRGFQEEGRDAGAGGVNASPKPFVSFLHLKREGIVCA